MDGNLPGRDARRTLLPLKRVKARCDMISYLFHLLGGSCRWWRRSVGLVSVTMSNFGLISFREGVHIWKGLWRRFVFSSKDESMWQIRLGISTTNLVIGNLQLHSHLNLHLSPVKFILKLVLPFP